jgi:hypothetical protein
VTLKIDLEKRVVDKQQNRPFGGDLDIFGKWGIRQSAFERQCLKILLETNSLI